MGDGPFSFDGRMGRSAWWLSQLALAGSWIGLFGVGAMFIAATGGVGTIPVFVAVGVGAVALIWFNLASCVKRYHDRGKSWLWMFFAFIPILGPLWQIVELGFFPGAKSNNEFGPAAGKGTADAFYKAIEEVEHEQAPVKPAAKKPIWAKGYAHSGATNTDATTKALKQNQERYGHLGGAPRASFGVRGT